MARAEQEQAIVKKFDTAIYGIRDAKVPVISALAEETISSITNQELPTILGLPGMHTPSSVDFNLMQTQGFLKPVFTLNPDKLLSTSTAEVQADIVRAIVVAESFPTDGYEEPLVDTYLYALRMERKWRRSQGDTSLVEQTEEQKNARVRELLGDARYFSDTGFADWEWAIEYLKEQKLHPAGILDELRPDVDFFLSLRAKYTEKVYNDGVKTMGKEQYETLENRREITALIYADLAAQSQIQSSN